MTVFNKIGDFFKKPKQIGDQSEVGNLTKIDKVNEIGDINDIFSNESNFDCEIQGLVILTENELPNILQLAKTKRFFKQLTLKVSQGKPREKKELLYLINYEIEEEIYKLNDALKGIYFEDEKNTYEPIVTLSFIQRPQGFTVDMINYDKTDENN